MMDARDGLPQQELDAAEQETAAAGVASSLYPRPPRYAAHYTRDNVARYMALKAVKDAELAAQAASSGSSAAASQRRPASAKRRRSSTNAEETFAWTQVTPQERLQRQDDILSEAAKRQEGAQLNDEAGAASDAAHKQRAPPKLIPAPSWDVLLEMEPPNVDWIEEDGFYSCFGEQWPVNEVLPSLQDMGMTQIYPSAGPDGTPIDRAAVLTTLLRTMLKSYLSLVDVLLQPPHDYLASDGSWQFTSQDRAREINDLAINMTHLLNETRPLQARHDLRDMMQAQLDRRRKETSLIKAQCVSMRKEVQALRQQMSLGSK